MSKSTYGSFCFTCGNCRVIRGNGQSHVYINELKETERNYDSKISSESIERYSFWSDEPIIHYGDRSSFEVFILGYGSCSSLKTLR